MYYYLWFVPFAIILYMMSVDKNVADYIILKCKIINLNIERWIWMVNNHPKNPLLRWSIERRSWKMAEELIKEINNSKTSWQEKEKK